MDIGPTPRGRRVYEGPESHTLPRQTFPLRPCFPELGCLTTWRCGRRCGRSCGALNQPGAGTLPAKRQGTPGTISKAVPGGFNTCPMVPGVRPTPNGSWRPGNLCGPPGIAGDRPNGNRPVTHGTQT
eukprot:365424-Chlamydomonas_euryale.AAC.2